MLDRKEKIKLQLFFDTENKELLAELEEMNNRHVEINEKLSEINNQIFSLLKDDGE